MFGIAKSENKGMALAKLNRIFDEIDGLIAHLTLLDIAAAFEKAFRESLKNAVGEARKIIHDQYNIPSLAEVREKLVRNVDKYEGLGTIEVLLEGYMEPELLKALRLIRENRNNFAHGTDVKSPPTIFANQAFAVLKKIAEDYL